MITIEVTKTFCKGDLLEGITHKSQLMVDETPLESWKALVGQVRGGGFGSKYMIDAVEELK